MGYPKFISIGYGNIVASDRIVCVVSPDSAPVKRMIQDAKEQGNIVDATYGRRTRAAIIMDSRHIVLTPLHTETIASRLNNTVTDITYNNSEDANALE